MADPNKQEKAHKEASPELPKLDEEDIESYIMSEPDPSLKSKKQSPKKLYKKAQNEAEAAESNYIPSTPMKSRSKPGKMESDQQNMLTPASTMYEMSPSQDGDADEANAQPDTPNKRVGWLGCGGRQWAKGYSSPGKGW